MKNGVKLSELMNLLSVQKDFINNLELFEEQIRNTMRIALIQHFIQDKKVLWLRQYFVVL